MEIAGLQQIYAKHPNMKGLAELLQKKDIRTIFLEGTHASCPSFFASAYIKAHPGVNLFILNDQEEAGYFYHDMVQANGDADILFSLLRIGGRLSTASVTRQMKSCVQRY